MPSQVFYSALARSILAGELAAKPTIARLRATLGRNWRWLSPLVRRFLAYSKSKHCLRRREVIRFLQADEGLREALARYGDKIRIAGWKIESCRMKPVSAARSWPVPAIESTGELADWLGIGVAEIEWFADLKGLQASSSSQVPGPLHNYHYRVLSKSSGGIRLIEAPKRRLKTIQKRILLEIIEAIPVHDAVHGFLRGRSIKTFASPHAGQRIVLRMDLRDFFPSLTRARVRSVFCLAGYPEQVADLLGGLCTNSVPRRVFHRDERFANLPASRSATLEAQRLYGQPHLPQGSPTSPALSNLCAYRFDCRLAGLARAAGAAYTRYADDLAFSGAEGFQRMVERFAIQVAAIALEEGFSVNHRKTRIMRSGVRQHLAGLVVNDHLNIARSDFDRLKALLTNCVRNGPECQNRKNHPSFRLHLEGRVGFVEMVNPAKGARLRKILEQIRW